MSKYNFKYKTGDLLIDTYTNDTYIILDHCKEHGWYVVYNEKIGSAVSLSISQIEQNRDLKLVFNNTDMSRAIANLLESIDYTIHAAIDTYTAGKKEGQQNEH